MRATLGTVALIQGGQYLIAQPELAAAIMASALAIVAGILLFAGFLTPVAATVAGLIIAGSSLHPFEARVLAIPMTVSFLLLGPGAYSVDARLFGPREIIIPPAHSLEKRF